ncbi:MAG: amylo-alpha-1,6-glucosidase [Spirochaetota bacterium]|nr:amylo-alpha-1,6-glucosidase [Spirochaetota bacterium]
MPAFSIFKVKVTLLKNESVSSDKIKVNIRTNLGHADRIRDQIIQRVEKGFAHEWDFHDIPLRYNSQSDDYSLDYILDQVGYFEWKLWVGSISASDPWIFWASGNNHGISVFPASCNKNNSIYCVFLRQFNENKTKSISSDLSLQEKIDYLEENRCTVIQPSGTFEEFKEELPFIINKLGMKIIHFLPLNPVPQTYGRMGKYGSPYASLDFFAVDPVYAYFDRFRTTEEQFIDLTSTIHYLDGRVILDMAVNHTGWASKISAVHSDWQVRKSDGEFISPGVWGVVWGDLVELDHTKKELWSYLAKMFIIWCERGVDGFRLDAGYLVPLPTWQYVIAKVREKYPDTFFLLEGLGGAIEITKDLLTKGMMNLAYSELFQNYTKEQIENYLHYSSEVSIKQGIMVHYAETHDNNRLALKGKEYTLMRLCLSAFTSVHGYWGFANGVEWLAKENIDVHSSGALNWGARNNLVEEISSINKIINENPCFWKNDSLQIIKTEWKDICTFYRFDEDRNNFILILINIDCENSASIDLSIKDLGIKLPFQYPIDAVDLLTGETIKTNGSAFKFQFNKGQTYVLRLQDQRNPFKLIPLNIEKHQVSEIDTFYRIMLYYFERYEVGQIDQELLLSFWIPYRHLIAFTASNRLDAFLNRDFKNDILDFNQDLLEEHSDIWNFTDKKKDFIIESHKWLITSSSLQATVYLDNKKIESVYGDDGTDWALFPPIKDHKRSMLTFHWIDICDGKMNRRWENAYYPVYSLPDFNNFLRECKDFHFRLTQDDILKEWMCVILSNGRGSILKMPLGFDYVHSKYDALLMANFSSEFPEDRIVLAKYSKERIEADGKFYDLDAGSCVKFSRYPVPSWRFEIDDGDTHFVLTKRIHLVYQENTTLIEYRCLEASKSISIQVVFFLEWRSYHENSKASELEENWKEPFNKANKGIGFDFHPYNDHRLCVRSDRGEFVIDPHWSYNIEHPIDATRAHDRFGDAYSPGRFFETLKEDEAIEFILTTEENFDQKKFGQAVSEESKRQSTLLKKLPRPLREDPVAITLIKALDQFLVKRGDGYTIIAGYPWFLDWGRDTLICVPGLITAGYTNEVAGILTKLAEFTDNGMVPNTIYGNSPGNYDTSDAPLWFFEAIRCYLEATEDYDFLNKPIKNSGVTIISVLKDIIEAYARGTENNIRLDTETGLIFSPAHFTWMDTQYPAATPRQGYPVEIQGLWINSLRFLAGLTDNSDSKHYKQIADKAEKSLWDLFWMNDGNYFADGIWTEKDASPKDFPKDTSLRPNQLMLLYFNLVPQVKARSMLYEIQKHLVIPGAIRSLADRPLKEPAHIISSYNNPVTDLYHLYRGTYEGDENTSRKIAYHNGTAWLWLYPYFVESFAFANGNDIDAVRRALCFLAPSIQLLREGAVGSLEEICDGNYPHTPRGCFAQAWSVAELLRVYIKLRLREIDLSI